MTKINMILDITGISSYHGFITFDGNDWVNERLSIK